MNGKIINNTIKVMVNGPIRDAVGHMHLRQCKPKLHTEQYVSLNRRNPQTPYDIESRIRQSLRLIQITRGL